MTKIDGGVVLLPGEARVIDAGGFEVHVLATAELTDGAYSLIETTESEAGGGPPLHIHRDATEAFFVINGAYQMHMAGRDFECPAGSFVYVPRGMTHTFRVLEPNSRKLNLYAPSAMEGYFDELAQGIQAGIGPAELDQIAERYEMESVGPPPESYLGQRS